MSRTEARMFGSHMILLPIVVTLLSLTGCGENLVQPARQIEGKWGGEHIVLVAGDAGGMLEYDCAHGTIDESLIAGADGHIDVVGTHTRETGGPVHVDEQPDIHPARYRGRFSGKTLTLTITLTDGGEVLGPYVLVLGEPGLVYKCL